jgi:hypothetical protein
MPRPLRIEYEGARYYVMSRGDRREAIAQRVRDQTGMTRQSIADRLKMGSASYVSNLLNSVDS